MTTPEAAASEYVTASPEDTQRLALLATRRQLIALQRQMLDRQETDLDAEATAILARSGFAPGTPVSIVSETGGPAPLNTFVHAVTGQPFRRPAPESASPGVTVAPAPAPLNRAQKRELAKRAKAALPTSRMSPAIVTQTPTNGASAPAVIEAVSPAAAD